MTSYKVYRYTIVLALTTLFFVFSWNVSSAAGSGKGEIKLVESGKQARIVWPEYNQSSNTKEIYYDETKNTLILNGLKTPGTQIRIEGMDDNFKIFLRGKNDIASIFSTGKLHVSGNGVLNVNKQKRFHDSVSVIGENASFIWKDNTFEYYCYY